MVSQIRGGSQSALHRSTSSSSGLTARSRVCRDCPRALSPALHRWCGGAATPAALPPLFASVDRGQVCCPGGRNTGSWCEGAWYCPAPSKAGPIETTIRSLPARARTGRDWDHCHMQHLTCMVRCSERGACGGVNQCHAAEVPAARWDASSCVATSPGFLSAMRDRLRGRPGPLARLSSYELGQRKRPI